jgi:hypothetical protein
MGLLSQAERSSDVTHVTEYAAPGHPVVATPAVPSLPDGEDKFISAINSFKARYQEAPNEFRKSAIRRERASAIANTMSALSVTDWVGQVSSMTTTSDGQGSLAVKLPGGIGTVATWNNGFSDIGSNTLIPHGSPLYEEVSHLAVGNTVVFDGTFSVGNLDYLKEASLTEEGSLTDPVFIFTFSHVKLR